MFICFKCLKPSSPGEKPELTITAKRDKTYPFRQGVNTFMVNNHLERSDDKGGKGWEIVREQWAHRNCEKRPPSKGIRR